MARRQDPTLDDLGLKPAIGPHLSELLAWLNAKGLTSTSGVFDHHPLDELLPGAEALGSGLALAQATSRHAAQPLKPDELKALKERSKNIGLRGINQLDVWSSMGRSDSSVRALAWQKLPAEAMAFYRPFHFPPFDQWGIYLLIGPLLNYHRGLLHQSKQLRVFSAETLMHLVLFEVFNHEFFHHLVESTATTLEILLAAHGQPQPLYLQHRAAQRANHFQHPHAPLEEALANAYAYNALGFISRVKTGFKTASVKSYQKAVVQHWNKEPAGYREAHYYAGAGYVDGAAALLGQLLQRPDAMHDLPLATVAKHVMPSGFSALMAKPDVPTWLVGSTDELTLFQQLVPAPNEAYTQLFWPYNTDALDKYLAAKLAEQKAQRQVAKAAAKAAPVPAPGADGQGGLF